jgi:hypothetical protein
MPSNTIERPRPRYNVDYLKRRIHEWLHERQRERERLLRIAEHNMELLTRAVAEANRRQELNALKVDFTENLRELSASDLAYLSRRQARRTDLRTLLSGRDLQIVEAFEDALEDVGFVRRECRRCLGFAYPRDSLLDIVASFHGLDIDQLVNYSKNRNRK